MKLGLGEGDIQDLIKTYDPLKQDQIEIGHFADDLNKHIADPALKINLKSLVNQTVGERIIEPETPSPKSHNKIKDPKLQAFLTNMLIDI